MLRSGLWLLIETRPLLKVVGEAGDAAEVLEKAHTLQPDLILPGMNMPEMDGLAAIPELCRCAPQSFIVILTTHGDAYCLRQSLDVDASGYLLKKPWIRSCCCCWRSGPCVAAKPVSIRP